MSARWRRVLGWFGYGAGGRALTTTGPDDRAPGQPLASGGIVRDVPVVGEDGCVLHVSVHDRPDFFDGRPSEVRYTYVGGRVSRFVGRPNPACSRCWPGDGHDHHCHERPCYRIAHRCLCGAEITDPPPVRGRFVGEAGPELLTPEDLARLGIPPGSRIIRPKP